MAGLMNKQTTTPENIIQRRSARARKDRRQVRDERLIADFNRLYHQERKRYDDCILYLTTTYFLSREVIVKILKAAKVNMQLKPL